MNREAHLRFLPVDPQLAEQAHKARIGAIVVDDKSGIDGPGALRRGDIHGGGVAAYLPSFSKFWGLPPN